VKLPWILRDQSGTTAPEFALTAPVFFLFIFGVIEVGLLFWTQIGMQHGAEMAARCASINAALCPTSNPNAIIGYATEQAIGLNLPTSTFTYSTPACGNQVNGSYSFHFPSIIPLAPLTLTAQACFPS
jgi:Flp pilus assembly protein TadG